MKENIQKKEICDVVSKLNYNKTADKAIMRFILMNLEYVEGGYSRVHIKEGLTLEHVYPKSVEKKGKIKGWPRLDFDYAEIGHGLGNLTLLPASGPRANGSAGEECFKMKRDKFLLLSPYTINRYFEHLKTWKGADIKKRLKYIQGKVWKHWGN